MKSKNSAKFIIKDGKIKFKDFIYALAPMAGVTDFAFRKICADFGADMVVTEMISLKALNNNSATTAKMLREESNAVRCCQIFTHEADIVPSTINSHLFDDFDIIDINCGCPAPKIVKNKDGSAMMSNLDNTRKVISNLVAHSNKPVSVKFRLGINGVNNYIEFAKMCEECGVSFLTLHARTKEQGYAGTVNKEAYGKLIKAVKIPVFWSGDIITKQDAEYAKSIGCAGVMIGRASLGNPEIFSTLKGITPPYTKKQAIINHLNMLKPCFKTEKNLVAYFKKHLMWYVKATPNAKLIKLCILDFTTLKQIEDLIEEL